MLQTRFYQKAKERKKRAGEGIGRLEESWVAVRGWWKRPRKTGLMSYFKVLRKYLKLFMVTDCIFKMGYYLSIRIIRKMKCIWRHMPCPNRQLIKANSPLSPHTPSTCCLSSFLLLYLSRRKKESNSLICNNNLLGGFSLGQAAKKKKKKQITRISLNQWAPDFTIY